MKLTTFQDDFAERLKWGENKTFPIQSKGVSVYVKFIVRGHKGFMWKPGIWSYSISKRQSRHRIMVKLRNRYGRVVWEAPLTDILNVTHGNPP